jgi:hypothetical protein
MRLIAVAPGQGQARPIHRRAQSNLPRYVLKSAEPAIKLRCEPDLLPEQLSKAPPAEACFSSHCEYAADVRCPSKFS